MEDFEEVIAAAGGGVAITVRTSWVDRSDVVLEQGNEDGIYIDAAQIDGLIRALEAFRAAFHKSLLRKKAQP